MFEEYKNLWVYIESDKGSVANVGLELLNPARNLADRMNEKLIGIVIGDGADAIAEQAIKYGADEVIKVEGDIYSDYSTEGYANVFCTLIQKYKPSTVFIGATNRGRDLGPRIACRLRTGLTADCTALDTEDGNIIWTRPAFGGNLMANILCPNTRPQIGTVRPRVFKKADFMENKTGKLSFISKVGYAMGDCASQFVWTFVGAYLTIYSS